MLKKEHVAELEKTAGIKAGELASAISNEKEVDIEITTEKHFSKEEWENHNETLEAEKDSLGKSKYDEGKDAGGGMIVRDMKITAGLEYEGKKPETFIEKYKEKILSDADKNPDKRVTELEGDIAVLRDKTLPEKEGKIEELNGKILGMERAGEIQEHLPTKLPVGVTQKDAKTIIMSNLDFSKDDKGHEVVKRNGEILKDKTRKNIGFKVAIADFATERKWMDGKGGKGGGSEIPGGGNSDYKSMRKMSELNALFVEKNINPMSEKANLMRSETMKAAKEAKEEFNFDE